MVSACLLGANCRYDGKNNKSEKLLSFVKGHEVIPVCPETLGGLPTPRTPSEIIGGDVVDKNGVSRGDSFRKGANAALDVALRERPDLIVLQSRSPSCGVNAVYDGSFSGKLTEGMGVFAALAREHGFNVVDIADL